MNKEQLKDTAQVICAACGIQQVLCTNGITVAQAARALGWHKRKGTWRCPEHSKDKYTGGKWYRFPEDVRRAYWRKKQKEHRNKETPEQRERRIQAFRTYNRKRYAARKKEEQDAAL